MKNATDIDSAFVATLLARQFPQFATLPIRPVPTMGWDNRTFRLGDALLVRMPSAAAYAGQVAKERQWLPALGPALPVEIPRPVALGRPEADYPFSWAVYEWIEGFSDAESPAPDAALLADDLARFLSALWRIPPRADQRRGRRTSFAEAIFLSIRINFAAQPRC